MMTNTWPYMLRLALATYFLFNHLPALLSGFKNIMLNKSMFMCASEFLPPIASYNIWHGGFILLAALILLWPRPIMFLSISLAILLVEAYLNLDMARYGANTILIIVSILINIALLTIYGRGRRY